MKIEDVGIKIKEIYLPFLLVSLVTIGGYNLFRWLLDIKLGLVPLKEDLLSIFIPIALPWLSVMVFLRRRIRLLNFRWNGDKGFSLFLIVMVATIYIPLMLSQQYLEIGLFDLIKVKTVDQIHQFPKEKYFKVRSYKIDRNASSSYVTQRTAGRNNNDLIFQLYLTCPFKSTSNTWYGFQYTHQVSNRISDETKEADFGRFISWSERKFESSELHSVKYFEKLGYSDQRDGFREAIKEANPGVDDEKLVILVPKSDIFNQRLGNTVPWIFGSYSIGTLVLLLLIIVSSIDKKEIRDLKKRRPQKDDWADAIFDFFDPKGSFQGTSILLLLNVSAFIVMIFYGLNIASPSTKELLEMGGNRRFEVLNGEYWRLVTAIFLHSGFSHLLTNLMALLLSGAVLEGYIGRNKLILSFMVCGILASITSIYWHENSVGVGASGAIFGLYGLILTFSIFKIFPYHMRGMIWTLLGVSAGLSLLMGLRGGVDNAAHLGGLISGCIIGVYIIIFKKINQNTFV